MPIFKPTHVGTVLKEIYLDDYNLTVNDFALKLDISEQSAFDIIIGKKRISVEIALKLEKAFKIPSQYWLDIQQQYEIWKVKQTINLDNVEVIAL